MAFVTTTSPDVYAATTNLEEIPAGADVLQYADDDKMNQIRSGLLALHGWASGVPISETANGHFLAMAAGSSAAVSVAAGVRLRQSSGAIDYSYNTGAYVRLLSKLTLASQATGDIMYASAADTWTRLAAGTNGHVLTLAGGVPTWAAAGGGGGGLSSPVGAADGGTGITSYAVGDIIYASGATTLSKLADVATGNALISGGVTTAPAWGKIGLTTHVSGTLPAANGGTGNASYAVGDLLQASGATTLTALAAVATGNVLISGGVTTVSAWGKVGLATHISGTLAAGNGGTGQGGGYAIGDMLYASGASALSKLAAVAVGQVLISSGVTTAPAYSASPLVTDITVGGSGSSSRIGAWATDTKIVQIGGTSATASYRGITGVSGAGTDKAGGDLRLQAGASTGAAAGGDVEIWHPVRTTGSDAVENTVLMTWEFTAPTDVGDGTGVAHSDLLPAVTAKNYLGSTSKRLISGYFDTQCFANILGSADDTNSYLTWDESDGAEMTLGGTTRFKYSASRFSAKFASGSYPASYDGVSIGSSGVVVFHALSTSTTLYCGTISENDAGGVLFSGIWGSSAASDGITGVALANSAQIRTGQVLQIHTNAANDVVLGANSVEFVRLVSGGQIKFSQMFKTVAGNEQTTIGAAGGASALPATPTKYIKFKDSAGTTLIIPAYAAS